MRIVCLSNSSACLFNGPKGLDTQTILNMLARFELSTGKFLAVAIRLLRRVGRTFRIWNAPVVFVKPNNEGKLMHLLLNP